MASFFLNPKVLPTVHHPDALILHPHAQRTGGNTMHRAVFAAVYGTARIHHRAYGRKPPEWLRMTDADVEGIRVVCDHFDFFDRTHVTRPLLPIAVIRHPLYRAVSLYHFVRRKKTHPQHALSHALDLEAFYAKASLQNPRYYSNLQCRRICGVDDARMALERVDAKFLAVGFTEQLDEFVAALEGVFGWPKLGVRPAKGIDAERYEPEITRALRERVLADNEEDLLLFETIAKGPPHAVPWRGAGDEARAAAKRAKRWAKDMLWLKDAAQSKRRTSLP